MSWLHGKKASVGLTPQEVLVRLAANAQEAPELEPKTERLSDVVSRLAAYMTDEPQPERPQTRPTRASKTRRPVKRGRRTGRRLLLLTTAVAVVAVGATGVFAYFTTHGTGTASAGVASLSAPGSPAATAAGPGVTVTWSASTVAGTVAATSYTVERYDGSGTDLGAATCSPVASSSGTPDAFGTFSCSDSPGASGTYKYKVTGVYNSWTATSGFSNTASVAATATKLVFTNQPLVNQNIQATGTDSFAVSVSIETAGNSVVSSDNSTQVTLAPDNNPGPGVLSCANLGGLTVTAVNGVASFTGCSITKAGTGYTLTASSSPVLTAPTNANAFNIIAGNASKLVFTTQPVGGVSEGTDFGTSPVVSVDDTNGNLVTTDTGNVTLALNSGPAAGSLACSNGGFPTIAAVAGVATFTHCQITGTAAAGTYTLKATRSGLTGTGASNNVVINVGALDHFAFAAASPQTDGVAFTGTNTLTAQDFYSNTVSSFNASADNVTVAALSPLTGSVSGIHGSNVLNLAGDFSSGVANLTALGMTYTGNATTGTFRATSTSGKTGTSGAVAITVGGLDHFAFTVASPQTDGVAFTGTNTLSAQDIGNNTIPTFDASTNNVTITALSPFTGIVSGLHGAGNVLNSSLDFTSGVANLTALGMTYTGNATTGTFRATAATGKTGTSGAVTIQVGGLDHFAFTAASPQTDGLTFTGTNTLTAQDVGNNTISSFNASTNNVTITALSPLTGAVSGVHGSNVLNLAGDFSSGVANLTALGMTYTGNAATGTFRATSAVGSKTGISGSVTIQVGALDHFALAAASPQTDGVVFTGANTLTAQDVGNNAVTTFDASTNNVTISALAPLTGAVSGIHGSNVLNQATDFSSGVANLTALGMMYTGNATTGTFRAISAVGSKIGTSGNVTVNVGVATHLTFTQQPTNTQAGVSITPAVTVAVQDVGNNVVTTDNATKVTLAIGANPGSGTLTGGGPVTVANGVATYSAASINNASVGYTLTATDTTAPGGGHPYSAATSNVFNVTAVPVSVTGFTTTDMDGKPEESDTITITFSGAIAPSSICSAWTTAGVHSLNSANISVTLTKPASGDNTLSVSDTADCSGDFKIFAGNSLDLGTTGYVTTSSALFGPNSHCNGGHPCATVAINAANTQLTITLGELQTGTVGTVASNPGVTYTPNASILGANGPAVTGSATDHAAKFF